MTRCALLPNLWRLRLSYIISTVITYRFCLLVRIRSEKWHSKLHSCFHAFVLCDIYTGMVTGMLLCYRNARSYSLGSWIMGNLPSYCIHQEYFQNMESTVKRKLSLGTFLWSYGRTFCHIWTIICREYHIQCVCQGQLNLIFKNLFGMITEWSPTFSPKHSNNIFSLR
jgi:hypothetical protein